MTIIYANASEARRLKFRSTSDFHVRILTADAALEDVFTARGGEAEILRKVRLYR